MHSRTHVSGILLSFILLAFTVTVNAASINDETAIPQSSPANSTDSTDSVKLWLDKMARASQVLNYDGYLVYQSGVQLESLKVVHRVDEQGIYEKIATLSGPRSEVIRDGGVVQCRLDDESNFARTQRFTSGFFPQLPVQQLVNPDSSYHMSFSGNDRIAGLDTRVIIIQPIDRYRYGLKLWIDESSGLLLRSAIINHRGKVIEQAMFTNINIGIARKMDMLIPSSPGTTNSFDLSDVSSSRSSQPGGQSPWFVSQLPQGFKLTAYTVETENDIDTQHLVYSDGVAFVSVYIHENMPKDQVPLNGLSRFGAMNVFGEFNKERFILAVGEVPALTVASIARSVKPVLSQPK